MCRESSIVALLAVLLSLGWCVSARADIPAPASASSLEGYIARVARAWEPYTTADGRVIDPLERDDTGDNYGVIMLADVMLRVGAREEDETLAQTGERIVERVLALQSVDGPFNLLAVAMLLRDGQRGLLGAQVWGQIGDPLARLAARIGPPSEPSCLSKPSCYNNWRLVWSAGASALLAGEPPGDLEADGQDPAAIGAEIEQDLLMARAHAGARVVPSLLPDAHELSDPGDEPLSYHLFSAILLEFIAEADPTAITAPLARLRAQAARYALELMAPDGQLSFQGRSLDQSWVQAAGAALGARHAEEPGSYAARWRSFADRALSYLLSAYPTRTDGILPMVPGLDLSWNHSIVDTYAALNQYEGLTLWLLEDALEHWPDATASRAPIPGDARELLVGDLRSSGLVWGRSGHVWWALSGHSTDSDPRFAQGLVSVKVRSAGGWRDLLALRPRRSGLSSAWRLTLHDGRRATPVLASVRGSGSHAVLRGSYRLAGGRVVAHVRWTLTALADGVRLRMSRPSKGTLTTTLWLSSELVRIRAGHAHLRQGVCVVTASGEACPTTVSWHHGHSAWLEVGLRRSSP